MKVTCFKVYDLFDSIVASGFPMLAKYDPDGFLESVRDLYQHTDDASNPHLTRALKLAKAQDGSGHKTFLSGILVSANITATNVWWLQFGRYHHQQIVSSQSKMHRLKEMLSGESDPFHPKVHKDAALRMRAYKNALAQIQVIEEADFDDEDLAYNCPMGLELTARVTTNYLQLRTIWVQRRNHKLQEWRDFCKWIENLPLAKELITIEK